MTRQQPCTHVDAVPVVSAGETVAALCPSCDQQLPAEWLTCGHPDVVEFATFGSPVIEGYCPACNVTYALTSWETA